MIGEVIAMMLVAGSVVMIALGWAIGHHLATKKWVGLYTSTVQDKDMIFDQTESHLAQSIEIRKNELQSHWQTNMKLREGLTIVGGRLRELEDAWVDRTGGSFKFSIHKLVEHELQSLDNPMPNIVDTTVATGDIDQVQLKAMKPGSSVKLRDDKGK